MTRFNSLSLIAAGVLATAGPAMAAGAGCCASMSAAAETKADAACVDAEKLNLTEEQREKIAALQAECEKDGCTETSRAAFLKGAEAILSAEQFAQIKEACGVAEKSEDSQS